MLKIRKGNYLVELEQLGFTYYNDKKSSYYGCATKQIGNTCIFINNCGIISISSDKSIFEIDDLYYLIKSDLIEIVKDDNNE